MTIIAQGVSVDAEIMGGEPCITGHRWPTRVARDYAERGAGVSIIQVDFPWITVGQIADALAWEFIPKRERKEIVKAALTPIEGNTP